jgi:hypothetical protein
VLPLGGNHSIQTIHGANDGKYAKTIKPGTVPGIGTQASAAAPVTANQTIIKLDNNDGSSSKEESDGESNDESSLGSSSLLTSSDEGGQANQPAGSG